MASKLLIQMMMLVILLLLFIEQAFAKNTNKSEALPGCQDKCGSLKISYPFGIGAKCSASKMMEIHCDNSFNPPKAFLRDEENNNLEVLNISLEAGTIRINYPITTGCTNTSNDLASHHVRLASPLTFSHNENRFTAMGCDNLALLSSESEYSSQLEAGGCLSRCNPSLKKDNSCFGINCCQTKFPPYLTFVKPSLSNVSTSSSGCSEGPRYAFIVDQNWFGKLKDINIVQTMETVPAVLNWKAFGACQSFIKLDPVTNGTLCGVNALCTNQSLCSCREGYEGNPYLPNGCQDINECAGQYSGQDSPPGRPTRQTPRTPLSRGAPKKLYRQPFKNSSRTPKSPGPAQPGSSLGMNRCEHYCTNTPGSFTCSCKDGWVPVDKFKCVKLEVIHSVTKEVDHRGKKAAIIVTTATCAGLGVVLVTIWWLYEVIRERNTRKLGKMFFKRNGGLLLQQQVSSSQENVQTTELFTSEELEKATDRYNVDRIVGKGGQGTVYKGMLTDGRIVAVKKTKIEDESKLEHFINEVVNLSKINHRNIVKLHGCCLETEVPLLVYEFIPNGTLKQYIYEDNEYFPLTWDVRVRVATEIAGALYYLHSATPMPIYHRDIKSTNILLDNKYRAKVADFVTSASFSVDQKVADFGTSASFSVDQKVADFGTTTSFSIDQTDLTTRVKGTFGYLDPEYSQSRQFTDKSDVYSFGVVLVELLTGQKPILSTRVDDEARGLASIFLLAMEENRILDIVDSRIINEGKDEEMTAFANIAYGCLNLNGRKRPTMKKVVAGLESIRNTHEPPTAAQQNYEEVENRKDEPNVPWESDVTSSSLSSTIYNSLTGNISSFL